MEGWAGGHPTTRLGTPSTHPPAPLPPVLSTRRLEVGTSNPAARAAALAEAKAAAAAAHAQRMEQHEKAIQQFRAVEQRLMA